MSQDYTQRIRNMVRVAATAAEQEIKAQAMSGICERFNLFFKPCTHTEDGILRMFPSSVEPPPEWKSAGADPLRIDVPYESYFTWIHSRSTRLPLLAPEY